MTQNSPNPFKQARSNSSSSTSKEKTNNNNKTSVYGQSFSNAHQQQSYKHNNNNPITSNKQNQSYNSNNNNKTDMTFYQPYSINQDPPQSSPVSYRYNITRIPQFSSQQPDEALINQITDQKQQKQTATTTTIPPPPPPRNNKSPPNKNKNSSSNPTPTPASLTIRDYRLQPAAIVWENGAASGITKTHFIAMKSSLLESRIKSKRGYCSILGGASDTTGITPQINEKNSGMMIKGGTTMKSTAAAKTGSNTDRVKNSSFNLFQNEFNFIVYIIQKHK